MIGYMITADSQMPCYWTNLTPVGSDVLLIARLNKEDPEHWNRTQKVVHDVPNELIQQLRALQELGCLQDPNHPCPSP